MKIKKASGAVEEFNPGKLIDSLVRAGADREQAREVIDRVTPQLEPLASTRKIYRLAHKYLRKFNRSSVLRYSLKKALLRLGPSGYPFEKYVGEILKSYGYEVKVGVFVEGKCVRHEIDVFAVNEKEVSLIECKYRNQSNSAPDVKIAMYVSARFQDIKPVISPQYPDRVVKGWLITNTRFTSDAVQFAHCSGLHIKSWRYPEHESLEKMIEDMKLYPVTVLSTLNSAQIKKLIASHVVLMKDLAAMEEQDIRQLLSITAKKARIIRKQAADLCFCEVPASPSS
jgi:Holliday junction resolvase